MQDILSNIVLPAISKNHRDLRELIVDFRADQDKDDISTICWNILRESSNQLRSASLSGNSDQVAIALELFQSGGALESISIYFDLFFGEVDLDPLVEFLQRVGKRLKFLHIRRTNSKLVDAAIFAASKYCNSLTHLRIDADCTIGALRALTRANAKSLLVLRAPVLDHHSFKFQDIWKPFRDSKTLVPEEIDAVSKTEFSVPLDRFYGPNMNKFWESLIIYRLQVTQDADTPLLLDETRDVFKLCHPRDEPIKSRARAANVVLNVLSADNKNLKASNIDFFRNQLDALLNLATDDSALPCDEARRVICDALNRTAILGAKDSSGDTLKTILISILTKWLTRDTALLEHLPGIVGGSLPITEVFSRLPHLLKRLLIQKDSMQQPLAFSYFCFPGIILQAINGDYSKLFSLAKPDGGTLFEHILRCSPVLAVKRMLLDELRPAFEDDDFCISIYSHNLIDVLGRRLDWQVAKERPVLDSVRQKLADAIWNHVINTVSNLDEVKRAASLLNSSLGFGGGLRVFVSSEECLYDISSAKLSLEQLKAAVNEALEKK
jgi:hypothetical protein